MNKTWAMRKNAEAVSPVIATILMVAITVVLAAVLYVMVLGFGTGENTPTVLIQSQGGSGVGDGVEVAFTAPSSEVDWGQVTIQFTDGTNTAVWNNFDKEDLTGSPPVEFAAGTDTLGALTVYLNITDLSGNGQMSAGDFVTLEIPGESSWSSSTTYELRIIHEPSDGQMLEDEIEVA